MEELKKYPTCKLVEELATREGVEKIIADPYQYKAISLNGPATILVVVD